MHPAAVLLCALVAATGILPAQVAPGRVLVVQAAVAPGTNLLVFEPLLGTQHRLDTTALGNLRTTAAVAERNGLILCGAPSGAVDDLVFRAPVQGNTVGPPSPLATGLRGRAVSVFPSALPGEHVIVTDAGVFAAPAAGGVARGLSNAATRMGNTDAALAAGLLASAGTGPTGAPGVWFTDLQTLTARFLPVRLPPPLAVAAGIQAGSFVLGDGSGQVWAYEPATQALTPWVHLGNPVRRLLANLDQRHWLGAAGNALHVFRGSNALAMHPLPAPALALDYRAYESAAVGFGLGCLGNGPRPPELGAIGRPFPGNVAFAITLAQAPAGTLAFLLLGGDRISIPLDAFGMLGCRLHTTPLLTLGVSTGATGAAQYPLPVPPNPDLVGGGLQVQWLVHDRGGNPASFTTSNAAALVF